MSVFFSVINNTTSILDDSKVSTETTYSSYKLELKIQELLAQMMVFDYKEYPANSRGTSQKTFLTPNSHGGLLLVLREGVKMAPGDDYNKTDDFHIDFVADVPDDLSVFILVLNTGAQTGQVLGGATEYTHTQQDLSPVWNVDHNLGNQYPDILIVNSLNQSIKPLSIEYKDLDSCIITLDTPNSGKAICRI